MISKQIHTKRDKCRLCNAKKLKKVLDLKPIPLSENYLSEKTASESVKKFPIDLYMCVFCGHVQHLDIINPEILWEGYTYFSSESNGMVEHFENVSNFIIEKIKPTKHSLIVDIGSNDGSFLETFKKKGFKVCGVDPADEAAKKANQKGITTFIDLFNDTSAKKVLDQFGRASIITAFNVFAHADDLREMVEAAKSLLSADGVFVFEAQYLADVINKKLVATIFHEHISHHSVTPLQNFFESLGMELISIKHDDNIQHGSIIGIAQFKNAGRDLDESVSQFIDFEKRSCLHKPEKIQEFGILLSEQRTIIQSFVEKKRKQHKSFIGFGAARSAPTLIAQFGINESIEFIVDDAPSKINCYSPGDGILVRSSEALYDYMPDYTFILAWVHAFKIIENNKKYLEKGGSFILLSPNTKIVNKDGEFDIEKFEF